MFLDLDQMRATKPTCRKICRAARRLLNDVRWLGMHFRLPHIYNTLEDLLSYDARIQAARCRSNLTTAEFDERFLPRVLHRLDPLIEEEFGRLLDDARRDLLSGARPWLSRAALARVRACPAEAAQRSEAEADVIGPTMLPLLPLHLAFFVRLSGDCVAALADAHPPSPSWPLADLLRARQCGEAAALQVLAGGVAAAANGGALPLQLSEYEPTFLHVACAGTPSAALIRALLELSPVAATHPLTRDGLCELPLQRLCRCMGEDRWRTSPDAPEAVALLARAHPAALAERADCQSTDGATPLFLAALHCPEQVPALLRVYPAAAAVEFDDGCSDSEHAGMLPLHAACLSGDATAIRALLDAHPQARLPGHRSPSPLFPALLPHLPPPLSTAPPHLPPPLSYCARSPPTALSYSAGRKHGERGRPAAAPLRGAARPPSGSAAAGGGAPRRPSARRRVRRPALEAERGHS